MRLGRPNNESGQTSAEYSLVLAAIAIGCVLALVFLGSGILRSVRHDRRLGTAQRYATSTGAGAAPDLADHARGMRRRRLERLPPIRERRGVHRLRRHAHAVAVCESGAHLLDTANDAREPLVLPPSSFLSEQRPERVGAENGAARAPCRRRDAS